MSIRLRLDLVTSVSRINLTKSTALSPLLAYVAIRAEEFQRSTGRQPLNLDFSQALWDLWLTSDERQTLLLFSLGQHESGLPPLEEAAGVFHVPHVSVDASLEDLSFRLWAWRESS